MPASRITPAHPDFPAYLDLRYRVMREPLGQPRGSERVPADEEPTSRHWLWKEGGQLLACLLFQATPDVGVGQVRFMAVEQATQGKGIGKQLMEAMETDAKAEDYSCITLNAREGAVGFYERLGYTLFDEIASSYGIRHWRMEKQLA